MGVAHVPYVLLNVCVIKYVKNGTFGTANVQIDMKAYSIYINN